MGKESIGYLQESEKMYSLIQKVFLKKTMPVCVTFRNFPKVPFFLNSHAATESTAATYTERIIRK